MLSRSATLLSIVVLVSTAGASCHRTPPARPFRLARPRDVATAATPAPAAELRFDTGAVDRSVDPCNDFYDYACGAWRRSHPIPADRTSMSRYAELTELNARRERELVEAAARSPSASDPAEQRVGAYYTACLDEASVDSRATSALRGLLARIDAIGDADDVADVVAELHAHDVPVLFMLSAGTDLRDSDAMIAALEEGSLGLGSRGGREEYLRSDAAAVGLRQRYRQHVVDVLGLLGGAATAGADADRVLAFETALARSALTAVQVRDTEARYHPMTLAEVARRFPGFRWERYARARSIAPSQRLNVTAPAWLDAVGGALSTGELPGLRSYLRLRLAKTYAQLLGRRIEEAHFDFYQRQLRGAREIEPRWKRCLRLVDRDRADAFGNAWAARTAAIDRDMARLGRPTDRSEFAALAQTVDGFGQKQLNNAGFTAGLLQPPVFDPRMDDAVNFGAIGAVMGHELTHQFDDEGRKYDARGNLHEWWSPEDVARFRERARCFVEEYSGFRADDGTPVNGTLTLGENIADNGGLRLAWAAAGLAEGGASIDGFTPAQRFFLSWAQIRCENVTPEVAHRRAVSDEHAPGRWRVNGVVSNMAEFARAFSCRAGSPMVRQPACRVW